ncbi:MAG TPA: dUTP diphosphatase [Sandaracinaceae bacterium]
MTTTLRVKRLRENAVLPRYATDGAAGMDLAAALDDPITLAPGARAAIPTGIALALPPGHEGQVRPRSGLARRAGVTIVNAPGTIDEDYRGEIEVLLVNLGDEPVVIHPGDRIAQLVVAPIARVEIASVDELDVTARGDRGFGSTGTR